jgi:MoxR-like ATPase
MNNDEIGYLREAIHALKKNLTSVIRGKDDIVEYVLMALFSDGNILLEDVPGVGKTTLAKTLAKSLKGIFHRVQFTPDLLPADIVGGSLYNPKNGDFLFRKGPIFANILLADEINRASPRTQSALLEAMTEKQVTVEGTSHQLARPFIVIATQNPVEFHGTYPLPESQLDRFLISLQLGYPSEDKELEMLEAQRDRHPLESVEPVTDCETLARIQKAVTQVGVEDSVSRYILTIIRKTREDPRIRLGASPRASLMLYRASQALAFLRGRDFVVPDDVKELTVPILYHRITLDKIARFTDKERFSVIHEIVDTVPVPI